MRRVLRISIISHGRIMPQTIITNVHSDFSAQTDEEEIECLYLARENVTVFAPAGFALKVSAHFGEERRKKFTIDKGYMFMLQNIGNNEIKYVGP